MLIILSVLRFLLHIISCGINQEFTSQGLTIGTVFVKIFSHRYVDSSNNVEFMYYHRVIFNFRKTAADPLYQLHLLVDIPQDMNGLQNYAQNFTENYFIAYGIIGTASDIDSDKVYDFHTAYEIEPTEMKMNVPLDMNGERIINSPSVKSPMFAFPGKYLKKSDDKYVRFGGTDVMITPIKCKLTKLYFHTSEVGFADNLWFIIDSMDIATQHSRTYSYTGKKLVISGYFPKFSFFPRKRSKNSA